MGRWQDRHPEPDDGAFWLDELIGEPPWVDERRASPGHPRLRGDDDPYAGGEPVEGPVVSRAELGRASRLQRRRNRRRRTRGVIVFLVLIGLITGGAYEAFRLTSRRPPKVQPGQPVNLTIQPGEGSRQIGKALEEAGVIDSAGRFRAVASSRGLDGALKPGDYQLETAMDVDSVIDILVRGPNLGTPFTIPEGFTVDQVLAKIAATKRFSRASLQKALTSPDLEVPFRPKGVKSLEGLLFPQTYRIDKDATPTTVLQQMLDQTDSVMNQFDLSATPRHLSPYQILTIARPRSQRTARRSPGSSTTASPRASHCRSTRPCSSRLAPPSNGCPART